MHGLPVGVYLLVELRVGLCNKDYYLCLPMLVGHFGPAGLVSGTVVGTLNKDYYLVGVIANHDCLGRSLQWFVLGNLTCLWVVWAVPS